MIGWRFSKFIPGHNEGSIFEQLLKLFQELLLYTSGDVSEALSWLTELDKEYNLTTDDYGIADFIQELIDKGYIQPNDQENGVFSPTAKMEISLRQRALDDIFDQLKKSKRGNHNTKSSGKGDEFTSELRPYEFGDKLDNLAISESLRNAQINHGIDDFKLTNEDLEVHENLLSESDEHSFDDRYLTFYDPVWRRPDHTCEESCDGFI